MAWVVGTAQARSGWDRMRRKRAGWVHMMSMKMVKTGETKRATQAKTPNTSFGMKSDPATIPTIENILANLVVAVAEVAGMVGMGEAAAAAALTVAEARKPLTTEFCWRLSPETEVNMRCRFTRAHCEQNHQCKEARKRECDAIDCPVSLTAVTCAY